MNRVELESTVSTRRNIPRSVVVEVLQDIQDVILEKLRQGEKVGLVGFGIFHPRAQKKRRGKNPKTGEPVDIPASIKPAFRASKTLIQALNLPLAKTPASHPGRSAASLKKVLATQATAKAAAAARAKPAKPAKPAAAALVKAPARKTAR